LGIGKSLPPGSDPAGSSNSAADKQMGLDFFAECRMAMQAKSSVLSTLRQDAQIAALPHKKPQDVRVARRYGCYFTALSSSMLERRGKLA
jgi:hypothetical protein